MGLYKILKYLAALIGAIGIALFIWLMAKGPDAVSNSPELQESILNPFLYITYFILGLAIVLILVFMVVRMLGHSIKGTLIGLGGFILIFLVSYFAAGSEAITYSNGTHLSASGVKWMNTGLNMLYILLALAILSMLFSSVKNLTRK